MVVTSIYSDSAAFLLRLFSFLLRRPSVWLSYFPFLHSWAAARKGYVYQRLGTTCWVPLSMIDGTSGSIFFSTQPLSWCRPINSDVDWTCSWPLFTSCFASCDDDGSQLGRHNLSIGCHSRWVVIILADIVTFVVEFLLYWRFVHQFHQNRHFFLPSLEMSSSQQVIKQTYALANWISLLVLF